MLVLAMERSQGRSLAGDHPQLSTVSGGHSGGETPVPIPNTAVKPASADGTWGVAPWESRTPPDPLMTTPPPWRGRRHATVLVCELRAGVHPPGRPGGSGVAGRVGG